MALRDKFRRDMPTAPVAVDPAGEDDDDAPWPDDDPALIAEAINRDYTDYVLPVDPEGPLYGALAQGLSLACPITTNSGMQ